MSDANRVFHLSRTAIEYPYRFFHCDLSEFPIGRSLFFLPRPIGKTDTTYRKFRYVKHTMTYRFFRYLAS